MSPLLEALRETLERKPPRTARLHFSGNWIRKADGDVRNMDGSSPIFVDEVSGGYTLQVARLDAAYEPLPGARIVVEEL